MKKVTNLQMDELMNEARNEQPVMPLKEVEDIIERGHYTPMVGFRGIHIGLNNLIVMSGIVVSSLLVYMTVKVDKVDNEIKDQQPAAVKEQYFKSSDEVHSVKENAVAKTLNHPADIQPSKNIALPKHILKPEVKPEEQITASVNPIVPQQEEIAPVADAALPVKEAEPVKKILSGEFMITYYYKDKFVEMKLSGDDVSQLLVNSKVIAQANYPDYRDLIAEGRNLLSGNKNKDNSLNLITFFDTQLHSDLVVNTEAPYTFELTSSQLLINKVVQSEEVFRKYKNLYETKTGKIVTEGSTYRYQKGN